MKKNILSFLRRNLWFCLAVVVIISMGVVTSAEFIKGSRTMRVVATYGKVDKPFSSNYLLNQEPQHNVHMMRVSASGQNGDTATFQVTFNNFPANNPLSISDKQIGYTITADLVKISGSGLVPVRPSTLPAGASIVLTWNDTTHTIDNNTAGNATTLTGSLAADVSETDTLYVEFYGLLQCDPAVFLSLKAEPDAGSGLPTLNGLFGVTEGGVVTQTENWEGYFVEPGPNSNVYDGYNYVIHGNGKGTVTLTWDSTKLELSQAFRSFDLANSLTAAELSTIRVTGNSIKFPVDSEKNARYELQFYPAQGVSWTDVSSTELTTGYEWKYQGNAIVSCSFEPQTND